MRIRTLLTATALLAPFTMFAAEHRVSSPDGKLALVVSDDQNGVQIFDVTNPGNAPKIGSIAVPLSDGRLEPMLAMDYSAKRSLLALGGAGGLALWDVKDPAKPVSLSALPDINGKKVSSVFFNADGTRIVVAADDSESYSDHADNSCVMDVGDPLHPVKWSSLTPPARDALAQAVFGPDDKFIASTGRGSGSSAIFQLWDATDPHSVRPVDSTAWWGQGESATKLGLTLYVAAGGPWKTLVVGVESADSKSQDLQFLDFSKPQAPAKQWYFQSTSGAVAFHPAHPVVAIGDARSGATNLYDMADPHRPAQVARLVADEGAVQSLAFSPDGTQLAVGLKRDGYGSDTQATVYFWKVA